jgi:hypothetical protein
MLILAKPSARAGFASSSIWRPCENRGQTERLVEQCLGSCVIISFQQASASPPEWNGFRSQCGPLLVSALKRSSALKRVVKSVFCSLPKHRKLYGSRAEVVFGPNW